MRRLACVLSVAVVLFGCEGFVSSLGGRDGGFDPLNPLNPFNPIDTTVGPDGVSVVNKSVYERLKVDCEQCHSANQSKPYFASVAAFEGLLVYAANNRYVVRGKPEESELIRMLRGVGTGPQPQMPPQGETFAAKADRGATAITMPELEEWIRNLPNRGENPATAAQVSSVRRKEAELIVSTLMTQLGLSQSDFYSPDMYPGWLKAETENFPTMSNDLAAHAPANAKTFYGILGGPDWLGARPRNNSISSTFAHLYVGMSQTWCRKAVQKPGNGTFFRHSSPSDTLPGARDAIRKNIAALHLTMLGEKATDEDLNDLEALFNDYQADSSVTAWTAVCSALVRDPLWLTY
jgi:hypothetical protein